MKKAERCALWDKSEEKHPATLKATGFAFMRCKKIKCSSPEQDHSDWSFFCLTGLRWCIWSVCDSTAETSFRAVKSWEEKTLFLRMKIHPTIEEQLFICLKKDHALIAAGILCFVPLCLFTSPKISWSSDKFGVGPNTTVSDRLLTRYEQTPPPNSNSPITANQVKPGRARLIRR